MKKTPTETQAYSQLSASCAAAEHCISDIRKKLCRWEIPFPVQERIINQLIAENFINEPRYIRAFIHDKLQFAHWGRYKIAQALRAKGIADSDFNSVLNDCDDSDYFSQASSLLRHKIKSITGKTERERTQKLIRFALGRGFELDLILKILQQLGREAEE